MFVHRRTVTIEWGDCDSAGIVFYPRYFAMFDASTAYLFQAALGMRQTAMERAYGIIGIPMVDTRAAFHIPSTYGDDIVIESQIESFGRSSFSVKHRILKGEAVGAECWEKRVWTGRHPEHPERLQGVAIPGEVISRFQ